MAKKSKRVAHKKPAKKVVRKPVRKAAKTSRASKPKAPPAKLAAFTRSIMREEEAPVAVRSFIEARQGVEASKELNVKTGEATPIQRIEPLAGPAAVPRRTSEEFQMPAPAKKGKKGAPPTKDDFGRIELRMQRGAGDEKIGEASPDYLQRSFNKAAQSGKTAAAHVSTRDADVDDRAFKVREGESRRVDASLTDFGEVEIAQQTRRGSKKLGNLEKDADEE